MSHTPTPWEFKEKDDEGRFVIIGERDGLDVTFVADTIGGLGDAEKANAAFIVKAVNCHDELLAALVNLYALVRGECPSILENDHHDEMVRAAIAKAEGR